MIWELERVVFPAIFVGIFSHSGDQRSDTEDAASPATWLGCALDGGLTEENKRFLGGRFVGDVPNVSVFFWYFCGEILVWS